MKRLVLSAVLLATVAVVGAGCVFVPVAPEPVVVGPPPGAVIVAPPPPVVVAPGPFIVRRPWYRHGWGRW